MKTVAKYASLVKFSHTFFAMPFALVGYVYGLTTYNVAFDWLLLLKILLCMVFARNAAMGFNRWADRHIDAANPRTVNREIPLGKISPRAAAWFVVLNGICFILTAWSINHLALYLSPGALFVLLGYSYTKRFTSWSHVVLGVALSIAPVGAFIAVTGAALDLLPLLLAALVMTWVSGFDILYSMQDAQFDRKNGLHSIPAKFSPPTAVAISIALHSLTIYCVAMVGMFYDSGGLYWVGAAIFISMLTVQQCLYTPKRVERIAASFGLVNGLSSVAFATFAIVDMVWRVL